MHSLWSRARVAWWKNHSDDDDGPARAIVMLLLMYVLPGEVFQNNLYDKNGLVWALVMCVFILKHDPTYHIARNREHHYSSHLRAWFLFLFLLCVYVFFRQISRKYIHANFSLSPTRSPQKKIHRFTPGPLAENRT